MITKEYDEVVTVLPDGQLQYLRIEKIMEDGVQLAASNWRRVYTPDQNLDDLPPRARQIAEATWTQEVIDAYVASLPQEENVDVGPEA